MPQRHAATPCRNAMPQRPCRNTLPQRVATAPHLSPPTPPHRTPPRVVRSSIPPKWQWPVQPMVGDSADRDQHGRARVGPVGVSRVGLGVYVLDHWCAQALLRYQWRVGIPIRYIHTSLIGLKPPRGVSTSTGNRDLNKSKHYQQYQDHFFCC